MIKPSLLTFTFCLILSSAYSQNGTFYTYDNAGNRDGYYQIKSLNEDDSDKPTEGELSKADEESDSKSLLDLKEIVDVFPNPTSGLVTVRWNSAEFIPYDLRVVSEDGRVIIQERVTNPTYEFDIIDQSPGSYVVFVNGSIEERTWQIIKK